MACLKGFEPLTFWFVAAKHCYFLVQKCSKIKVFALVDCNVLRQNPAQILHKRALHTRIKGGTDMQFLRQLCKAPDTLRGFCYLP